MSKLLILLFFLSKNIFAIDTEATGFSIAPAETITIDVHGNPRIVTSSHPSATRFISTKNEASWNSFLNNTPPYYTIAGLGENVISLDLGNGTALSSTQEAGKVASAHWNNPTGYPNFSGVALVDGNGDATSATATGTGFNLNADTTTSVSGSDDNTTMFTRAVRFTNGTATVEVSNVPFAQYTVIAYIGSFDISTGIDTDFDVTATMGSDTQTFKCSEAYSNYSGNFVEATSSLSGNYIQFTGQTSSTMSISFSTPSSGEQCTLAGLQIVKEPSAAAGGNYFVVTNGTWNGNLGGISGANAKCVSDLSTYDWKGKSNVTIDSSTTKAFLCSNSSCQGFLPSTTYTFAKSGSASDGGATFTTNASSQGPNDSSTWRDATHFGTSSVSYWMSRTTSSETYMTTTPVGFSCNEWTDSSSDWSYASSYGNSSNTDSMRWYEFETSCDASLRLICIVDD